MSLFAFPERTVATLREDDFAKLQRERESLALINIKTKSAFNVFVAENTFHISPYSKLLAYRKLLREMMKSSATICAEEAETCKNIPKVHVNDYSGIQVLNVESKKAQDVLATYPFNADAYAEHLKNITGAMKALCKRHHIVYSH
jgi:hypothetical protein